MRVAHDDLVISTQGRSFWILDDISPLRQLTEQVASADAHLFTPKDVYRVTKGGAGGLDELSPPPAPQGALIDFHLSALPDDAPDPRHT